MEHMTGTEASVIDEQGFSVTRTIRIAAPVEKVWSVVTEPDSISEWFGTARFDAFAVGASGTLNPEGYGVIPIRIEAIDEPRLVSYRWGNDDAAGVLPDEVGESSTVFTFTLEEVAGGTLLTVVETGFERTSDPVANLESHRRGWDEELDKLRVLVEGGA